MKAYILILITVISTNLGAQNLTDFFNKSDAFFKANVKNGNVTYSKIHKNQEELNAVLEIAKNISVQASDAANYQAFWINAYNLQVIKGIINNYPTKSPLSDSGFFDKTIYNIGGKKITLNDIEKKLLFGKFNDPRFHFVLVCGAIGCPPLISKAYVPKILNSQLDKQTKLALNGKLVKVNSKRKRVQASELFKWYKKDFTMNGLSEIDFINKYRTDKIPNNFKLSYFTYNWNLNKQ